ncbi:GNAT family N-acetyltransferase [Streptacidiphilus rugosus]|uniref:GNAT family N-acetyltransferase n=1 Tax=Streptacidiphilus rugosus TaxID=405783 RepID=UPI0038CD669D
MGGRMELLRTRHAGVDDVDAVLAFWKEAAEGTSISDDVAGVTRLVERDPEALILAEHTGNGGIVGSVIAGWDGWRASLYRLAVHPDHRRQGISRLLLDAAHTRFLAAGARRTDAMVLVDNELGQSAWSAAGYQREDHWRRWVRPLSG